MSFWDNHGGIELSKVRADYSIENLRDDHRPLIQTLPDNTCLSWTLNSQMYRVPDSLPYGPVESPDGHTNVKMRGQDRHNTGQNKPRWRSMASELNQIKPNKPPEKPVITHEASKNRSRHRRRVNQFLSGDDFPSETPPASPKSPAFPLIPVGMSPL